jgi:hypothetical protein
VAMVKSKVLFFFFFFSSLHIPPFLFELHLIIVLIYKSLITTIKDKRPDLEGQISQSTDEKEVPLIPISEDPPEEIVKKYTFGTKKNFNPLFL